MRFFLIAATVFAAPMPAAVIPAAFAQQSVVQQPQRLFSETSHDFGTVARNAKTEHRFYFVNPYNTPINVQSVRTSCGCTTPSIVTKTVKPGETGCILAVFNTGTHSGQRGATITVVIDQPKYSEFQLQVKGYIRTDIIFNPGEVSFGNVPKGDSKTVNVRLQHAGKSDWQVTGVEFDRPFIRTEAREVSRNAGLVEYDLAVTIDETAPAGAIQSELLLHTNDRNLKSLTVGLTANVEAPLSVQPSLLSLGTISPESTAKQLLVVKGQTPFRILSVGSEDFDVEASKLSEEAKTLHTLPVMLKLLPKLDEALDKSVDNKGKVVIQTDMVGHPTIELDVLYRIKGKPLPVPVAKN